MKAVRYNRQVITGFVYKIMNKEEILKELKLLCVAYPKTYKDFSAEQFNSLVLLWQNQFENENTTAVITAVENLIGVSVYAPTIADIKAETQRIKEKAKTLYRKHLNATQGIVISYIDVDGDEVVKQIKDGNPLNDEVLKKVLEILK